MVSRVVAAVALIILATFVVELIFLRGRAKKPGRGWDIAPVIGFVGLVLLGLAFIQAARREVMEAWRWGLGFGMLLSVAAGIALLLRGRSAANESGWRLVARMAESYGVMILLGLFGISLAVRLVGAMLSVFISSALGVLVLMLAVGLFAREWNRRGTGV